MIRKYLLLCITPFFLTACFDDIEDLQDYTEQVKSEVTRRIEPMPEFKEFEHIAYTGRDRRSPFVEPKPEAIQDKLLQIQDCLHPNPRRKKGPLEKFALDNLAMKGTLGSDEELWALIQASDGSLHRVKRGFFMGLYHGQIVRVSPNEVEIVELIPDGSGCWKERPSVVQMIEPVL
ncbi:pilus assembly protein PilP [Algicola sagamiensis]|uniref:pilus assembly protein PilP n=1 Tax=Algicola sagamiensis TaxID=163869 RepID=UPI00035D70CC|nr:pilus assembly protein PilP [Algicola sagamiensis]